MCGCTPLVRRPNSLAVLHIHSTPSGPRIRRGSSIMSPVSLSTISFVHSVGVVLEMLCAVVGPTCRAKIAALVCCAVRTG
jgi:hypothetical protein